jgi:hypothetical protein
MAEAAGCAASAFCAQPPRTSPSVPGLREKYEEIVHKTFACVEVAGDR